MSNVTGNPERTVFLVGQVAQSVGDYFALLKQYEEAKEEYQDAIAAYDQVLPTFPDFLEAQKNKEITRQRLDELPERRELSDAEQRFLSLIPDLVQPLVILSQWFQGIFDEGWQAVDAVLSPRESSPSFGFARSTKVRRAKVINWGLLDYPTFALVIAIKQESEQEVGVLVQVCPISEYEYLPQYLQLRVEFESESAEDHARSHTDALKLEFSGQPGEQFSIQVALGDIITTENFAL
jgi:hypothetical protein